MDQKTTEWSKDVAAAINDLAKRVADLELKVEVLARLVGRGDLVR